MDTVLFATSIPLLDADTSTPMPTPEVEEPDKSELMPSTDSDQNRTDDKTAQELLAEEFSLPPVVKGSGVASALTFFAWLDFIGAVIGGLTVGVGDRVSDPGLCVLILACGILGGFILLGFASVIENTNESSQRLHRIELLIQKAEVDRLKEQVAKLSSTLRGKPNSR